MAKKPVKKNTAKKTAKKKAVIKKTIPKKKATSPVKKKAAVKKKTAVKKAVVKKAAAKPVKKAAVKTPAVKKGSGKKPAPTNREKAILDIQHNLQIQKESLLKEASETLHILPGELNYPDMGDQATAETDRNFMLRLRDRDRGLLKKIDQTIDRIKSKVYGYCEACGEEIGIKRLQARPVTTLCVDCKTEQEEEERISKGI
ncbi:MAG: RNA polymerase-binding protein DksA [Thermodesulfovibrionia bacterium]|nr:RNA polymerase-binding protein DksA [Thermodesulfovibrionia bacterium]